MSKAMFQSHVREPLVAALRDEANAERSHAHMYVMYVVLTLVTAGCALGGAWANFTRHPIPVAAAEQVKVPQSLMRLIGSVFLAAALGLLGGLVVPLLGLAASIGLVCFFACAIAAHLRVGDLHLLPAGVGSALSVATLVVTYAQWS